MEFRGSKSSQRTRASRRNVYVFAQPHKRHSEQPLGPARYRGIVPEQRRYSMPTGSGHTKAILASKVKGTPVYNVGGDRVGHVEDIVLDKKSDKIIFAALGFGGVLGIGEKYAPVPWSMLDYQPDKG